MLTSSDQDVRDLSRKLLVSKLVVETQIDRMQQVVACNSRGPVVVVVIL